MPRQSQTKSRGVKSNARTARTSPRRRMSVLNQRDRTKFDTVRRDLDDKLKPVTDAVRDSQCLTREDYAIRINARD